jgi:hypothetical protein
MDSIENEKVVGSMHVHIQQGAAISRDVSFGVSSVVFKSFVVIFVNNLVILNWYYSYFDRLCGPVVRVPGYKSRGYGINSRHY